MAATYSTSPLGLNSGKSVIDIATRRPSVTRMAFSSRGSYQNVGTCTVSPANARRNSASIPFATSVSSSSTLYSGGGSTPNSSMNASLVSNG